MNPLDPEIPETLEERLVHCACPHLGEQIAAEVAAEEQKAKHTPTPWHIEPTVGGEEIVIRCEKMRGPGRAIAWMGENAEANAAFIVRACNAHDAMVDALEAMVNYTYTKYSAELLAPPKWVRDQARAALALARGESEVKP